MNNVDKFEPVSFDVWMNSLRRDPSAYLALLEPKQLSTKQRLQAQAAARGISPHRILWWPRISKTAHLARLRDKCDKFADNFIYGAHTTAADALWAGLPLITLRGWGIGQDYRFASRVGTSLLEASDLAVLALDSAMQFEDTLAGYKELTQDLKTHVLSASLKAYGAFDSRAKATELRRALHLAAEQRGRRHIICTIPTSRTTISPHQCALNAVLAGLNYENTYFCDSNISLTNTTPATIIDLARRLAISSSDQNADAVHAYGLALFLLKQDKKSAIKWLWSAVRRSPMTAHFWANLGRISGDPVPQLVAMRLGQAVEPHELRSALLARNDISPEKKFFAATVFLPSEPRLKLSLGAAFDAANNGDGAWSEWVDAVPAMHAQKKATQEQVDALHRARTFRKNRRVVIIYCDEYGQTWWPNWGPSSMKIGGLGGSEEAVIFVARELAKRGGHHIEIYTEPNSSDLGYDRVFPHDIFWLHHATWDPNQNGIHIFVAWRYHISATLVPNHSLCYVWLQDVPPYSSWTSTFLKSIHGVFVLSKFHAQTLPSPAQTMAIVAPNGIAPEQLVDGNLDRPPIFTYGSAPNRGLYDVLIIWSHIHAAIPQAELHIYYGFSAAFRKWGQQHIENYLVWEAEVHRLLDQDGIFYYGMVDHATLAQAYANASFILYPTAYPETGCVTLMKAMAMGALPITSRYAYSVVPELTVHFDLGPSEPRTVQSDVSITLGPRPDSDWLYAFAEAAISAARIDPIELRRLRQETMTYARSTFLWEHIARTWDHTFTSRLLK
uniref:O-GlcNAc transferase C-terminal domain-containing protein n=1 Tax=Aureoumbra lagunensis TaxID=44058 RepID=A0A7S3JQD7_9STRA